jgi:hypothetical protein
MRILVLALGAVIAAASPSGAPEQDAMPASGRVLAGQVLALEGTVLWRPDARTPPTVLRPPGIVMPRRLYAGESIKCEPGARIQIRIYRRDLSLDESVGWYPIPHVPGRLGIPDGELGGVYAVVPGRRGIG